MEGLWRDVVDNFSFHFFIEFSSVKNKTFVTSIKLTFRPLSMDYLCWDSSIAQSQYIRSYTKST